MGDTDWLEVAREEDVREPEMEGDAETEEDRHSEDVGLLVRLVLRERLIVTEVQPVAVPDDVRHRLDEAVELVLGSSVLLSVPEVQPVEVPDAVRHWLGEVVELALGGRLTEPVEDTEGQGEGVMLLPPPPPLVGVIL